MARNEYFLIKAAEVASKRKDQRSFWVGAVGRRADGVYVCSFNGAAQNKCPEIHAEARLCMKLDVGATVWVARMSKNGEMANAKPCPNCERRMRNQGVKKVYYTTGPDGYECIYLNT
jgi:deoxycytidylate deaminase